MTITAKISSSEITGQVSSRYAGAYMEAILINSPGVTYQPGVSNDATWLSNEVVAGTGGYQRQVISFSAGDVGIYSDDGVALTNKAAIFLHDGSATPTVFSHAALIWGSGNIQSIGVPTSAPTDGIDGTYENLPAQTAYGEGCTADVTIVNSGATPADYSITIRRPGFGYQAGDSFTIAASTLLAAGAVSAETDPLVAEVETVYSSADSGNIIAVAQTANTVTLAGGNEAAFYFNIKQFGFYKV